MGNSINYEMKKKFGFYLSLDIKIISRWIKYLIVKGKTVEQIWDDIFLTLR